MTASSPNNRIKKSKGWEVTYSTSCVAIQLTTNKVITYNTPTNNY